MAVVAITRDEHTAAALRHEAARCRDSGAAHWCGQVLTWPRMALRAGGGRVWLAKACPNLSARSRPSWGRQVSSEVVP